MTDEKKKPLRNYTIYLIKSDFKEVEKIINQKNIEYEEEIKINRNLIGTLYLRKTYYNRPRWAEIFREYIDLDKISASGSPSALVLIKVNGRFLAITFGQGRFLLVQDCWEERFGLKVALNLIGENKIKSLDKKTFDSISLISREQASKEIKAEEFGLDIEKDLLSAVVGFPNDNSIGERISGMDSFKIATRTELDSIHDLCKIILNKYEDNSYKNKYPWVDHLAEVKDKQMVKELDEELVNYIINKNFEKCWAVVPEIINWDQIEGFKYGFTSRSPIHYDIHLPEFIDERIKDNEIDIETLKNRYVHFVRDDHESINKWSIYKCIYCEVIKENNTYILNGAKWYKIDNDFVIQLNEFYDSIQECKLSFPEYNHDSETEYNEYVSKQNNNIALMDRKFVNNIEFCDLYDKDKIIIHVKRYGGSSVLSHLFMQGLNSAELFQSDEKFRSLVNDKLPDTHKIENYTNRPIHGEYEVVFAVIHDSENTKLEIPFFSKLTLRTIAKRLDLFGYKVSKKKISVSRNRKNLKKYPPGKRNS